MGSREEVIFITGGYGLEVRYFNPIKLLLVLLIVSLELKVFLYGRPLSVLLIKIIGDIRHNNSPPIRNIIADLVL